MDSNREPGSGEDSAASAPSPAEKPTRPDWLVGADEMISALEIQRFETARQPAQKPAAVPSRSDAPLEVVGRPEPPAHGDRRAPGPVLKGPVIPDKPQASGPSPAQDLVSGLDFDDFGRNIEAASAPDVEASSTGDRPSEVEPPWLQDFGPPRKATDSKPHRGLAPALEMPAAAPPSSGPPFWEVLLWHLRTDRRIHVTGAAAALTTIAVMLALDMASITPVARIRHDPARFDGRSVKLRGTVGEVFALGSSYTYYLHDGRDTIVVFTRTLPPRSRRRVTVMGSVSTGYLEGVPRAALFEDAP